MRSSIYYMGVTGEKIMNRSITLILIITSTGLTFIGNLPLVVRQSAALVAGVILIFGFQSLLSIKLENDAQAERSLTRVRNHQRRESLKSAALLRAAAEEGVISFRQRPVCLKEIKARQELTLQPTADLTTA